MTLSPLRRGVLLRVAAPAVLALAALAALLAAPSARADGIFVAQCKITHRAADDPIVYPRMRGMSHMHEFIGNTTTNFKSTRRTLRKGTSGCNPSADRSAYWVPELYKDGKAVKPAYALIYYQDYFRYGRVQPFPLGLRMIGGNMKSMGPQPGVRWTCEEDQHGKSATIPACGGKRVTLRVSFPDCWDGKRLDSRNHRSHMAYDWADGKEPGPQRCPADHPIVVPQLQVNVTYPIHDGSGVSLASGSVYSAHADFFDAWTPSALQQQVDDVLNGGKACHPMVGCTTISGPNTEPITGNPVADPIDKFYPPRGGGMSGMGGMAHHHHHKM
jgi:hypothetical protein